MSILTRSNEVIDYTVWLVFSCKQTPNSMVLLNKCKEKFVILQSIGIVVTKSRETRAVIYTCRYYHILREVSPGGTVGICRTW